MKKTIIALSVFFCSLTVMAQKKDSSIIKGSYAPESVISIKDSVKIYYIISTEEDFNNFIKYVQGLDEKPSVLNQIFDFIKPRLQVIQQPKK